MMTPRVLKTDRLAPLVPDRATLHELGCAFAEAHFDPGGNTPVVWLLAVGSNVMYIETNWENDHDEYAVRVAMRELMRMMGVRAYCHISEAWVAMYEGKPDIETMTLPSELPEDQRDDVLMVVSFDQSGGAAITRYLVSIRHDAPNRLGIRVDELITGTTRGNLLRDRKR